MNGRRRIVVLGLTAAAAVLLVAVSRLLVLANSEAPAGEDMKTDLETVPLTELHTTSEQKPLRLVNLDQLGHPAPDLLQASVRVGVSNAFLVDGKEFKDAVRATSFVYTHGVHVASPPNWNGSKQTGTIWFAAHLGSGGGDEPAWLVTSITFDPERRVVRLSYAPKERSDRNVRPYWYWYRLGQLDPGVYRLELFDSVRETLTFVRSVHVSSISDSPQNAAEPKIARDRVPRGGKRLPDTEVWTARRMRHAGESREIDSQLRELSRVMPLHGASNVFLARASTIQDAVRATLRAWDKAHDVDQPVAATSDAKSDQFWLVVHLGVRHSSPPAWRARHVDIVDSQVRFVADPIHTDEITKDLHPYLYWVPLGPLKPGRYELEVMDGSFEQPTLIRHVEVP
jgi:hypothetical protein